MVFILDLENVRVFISRLIRATIMNTNSERIKMVYHIRSCFPYIYLNQTLRAMFKNHIFFQRIICRSVICIIFGIPLKYKTKLSEKPGVDCNTLYISICSIIVIFATYVTHQQQQSDNDMTVS